MPTARQQELIAILKLEDQLSPGAARAKASLGAMETQATSTAARISSLGSSVRSLGLAFGVGLGATAFVSGLKDAVNAAREDELSQARLSAALKANVSAWDGNTQAIERRIAVNTAAAFSDDELRQSLADLSLATHDISRAFADQGLAIDLARFKQISLGDATAELVKIEAGNLRSLKSLGIATDGITNSTQALAKVREAVAGQSAAFLATDAGKAEAMNVALGELGETFGRVATGPITEATVALTNFFNVLSGQGREQVDQSGQDMLDNIAKLAQTATTATLVQARNNTAAEIEHLKATNVGFALNFEGSLDKAKAALAALDAAIFRSQHFAAEGFGGIGTAARFAALPIDDLGSAFEGSTLQMLTTGLQALHLKGDLETLKGSLDDLPEKVDIDINIRVNTAQALADIANAKRIAALGEGAGATKTFGGVPIQPFEQTIPIKDPGVVAFEEAQRQEAIARAKQQAQDEAAARREAIGNELQAEKRLVDTLFDALHDRTIKAIQDAEKLAQTKHDAAIQAIQDNLKEEESANAAPVNAAEQALREREQSQRRRDLIEAQQAAQAALSTNRDPARQADLEKSLRSATEALVNFDAQAAIDRLRAVQAGLDAASQSSADAATKAADAALKAAQDKAKQQTDAETIANQKRRDQFDTALEKLRTDAEKSGQSPAQFQAALDKLAARFGITIDPITGFHHITDPLVTAIKNVKIEPPTVTFNPTFKPTFKVNGRDIAIELQSGAQPASTANVRSGNSGR